MIFVYHNNTKVVKVENQFAQPLVFNSRIPIAEVISLVANNYVNEKIVWCHSKYKEYLNVDILDNLFHHNKLMLSYRPDGANYFSSKIGYVENSPFININKQVSYPTWQMSCCVGMINSSVLNTINSKIPFDTDFDYYISSVAKLGMPMGLLCYSEPELLKDKVVIKESIASSYTLFRFVSQHYRARWLFLLLLNLFLYERKICLLPFLFSFFYRKRKSTTIAIEKIKVQSSKKIIKGKSIDVIIPTIGRKKYLFDVLKDLAKQTILPKKVIIVEQNPVEGTESELDYLVTESWPFVIKHIFTHQAGACNARNVALSQVSSEWVFLADDDNRFEPTLLDEVFCKMEEYGNCSVTTAYPQKNEVSLNSNVIQSPIFGAGNSFVKKEFLDKISFNPSFEFGYGEDNDFGMQLRNLGIDVLYLPKPQILHLKAPMGGFRIKPFLQWQQDAIQPKPSPTIMLFQMLHNTKEQISGYKSILFFKYYKIQKIKNPIRYFLNFRKQWNQSILWAKRINKRQ